MNTSTNTNNCIFIVIIIIKIVSTSIQGNVSNSKYNSYQKV